MAVIEGKAKRYDGMPVDYVLLFDWQSGSCIGTALPDSMGNWRYPYYKDLSFGVTYVSDGCQPITHGAYQRSAPPIENGVILHYTFNGTTVDYSQSGINGLRTGAVAFAEGRKAGTQCIDFTNGCVQTQNILPINGDKVSISFWVNFRSIKLSMPLEMSKTLDSNKAFNIVLNNAKAQALQAAYNIQQYNTRVTNTLVPNRWYHVIVTMDIALGGSESTHIYIDNIDQTNPNLALNNTGNFDNDILYIGQRAGSSLPMDGKIQDLRIYNRILSADERLELFNE